ncbi:ABC transporter ATP-binding protein [Candidatus Viridilinea mediisalina]|uniref:ABC transporter n=1 Tax=Candidatus Viridilinea mediisalina TaxID=2024553 RepID=A0A2A6RLP6_9CHLR|nr:ABC transporter ATP-binding protein [Candidatus Viridilinea mediisalina]PDW03987.1 ABC transporter [Candidatus Viridilinea mediisalina]
MNHLRHLWPYLVRYRRAMLAGLLCAALGAGVSTLAPLVLRLAVDELTTAGVLPTQLLHYGALLLLIALADGSFKFIQRMLIAGASYEIEHDLRRDLFEHYLRLDQAFFSQHHTGDLMARATNDLSSVRQLLGPGISGTATALLTFGAAAILMLLMHSTLALVVLLLLPMTTLVFVLVGNRMRRIFTKVQDQFGLLSTRVQENFSGIRTIKAYGQEEAELAVFAADNAHYRQLNLRYVLLSGALWPTMLLCLGAVAALTLFVGGRLVVAGELTLGQLVQFNAYVGLLTFPVLMLGWVVSLYQQAAASMGRLVEIFQGKPAIVNPPTPQPLPTPRGAVTFDQVGVRFAEQQPGLAGLQRPTWMLRDISFHIPPGGSLAIVGATGSGKTTLVNLLARVRDPDAGQVLLDGYDLRSLDLADLRRAVGYVPQETFLFSVALRENVAFGVQQVEEQTLEHALHVSRLVNDLEQFPDGIDTLVGERGVTLSGGQKQRVAIARAIVRDPAILVLDDALSSVDSHTAAEILAGLRSVMQGRTSIIIAQRVATVRAADQIIVLHEGQVAERGSHSELLRINGHYAAMYRRELLAAELEEL